MDTAVLPIHTFELLDRAVCRAADALRQGAVVGVPTETVYGLAANAFDSTAVGRIFEAKQRPANNPLIVHVASLEVALRCVRHWPDTAAQLAAAFWPGPLTLVLPRSALIPDIVTAGGETVAIRWPRHPFIQRLIAACGFPLAAPSANLSGHTSPTTAEHVLAALGGKIPLVVDGGPASVGIESTVVDLSVQPARVLRPGMIHAESLASVLGGPVIGDAGMPEAVLRSPGRLDKHYAPRVPLLLLRWRDEADLTRQLANRSLHPREVYVLAHSVVPTGSQFERVSIVPHDPEAFARALYAELHRADESGAKAIVAEAVPDAPEWAGIGDRLRRASTGRETG